MNPAPPIEAKGLVKRYGDLVAVNGVDLEVHAGTCLGLLGPNGAGKTTTIEMLEGLLDPDGGSIRIVGRDWGADSREIRKRIGVQLQETRLPEKLTVREILATFRSFYEDGPDPEHILERVGLRDKADARSVNLSGGQRQRLALGCALVNDPEVLFLDEPTTGLDPQARRRVWEIVEEFKGTGRTVLLTTHYMDEAERLSDDVMIVDHGKVISRGSPRAIIDSLEAESFVVFSLEGEVEPPLDRFRTLPGVITARREDGRIQLGVGAVHETVPAVLEMLSGDGLALSNLQTHRPTLEDVFVSLTGRHLRDE